MRPTFFQNQSSISGGPAPESVVLNFLSPASGGFNVMYLRGSTWVPGKPKDLLTANEILVNFAYLGGTHFCNYSLRKRILGNRKEFTFTLNKVPNYQWDIANAVFAIPKVGSLQYPGASPVCTFSIQIDLDTYVMSYEYETLQDRYASSGASTLQQVWWYGDEETHLFRFPLMYNNGSFTPVPSEKAALSLDLLGSDIFIREVPIFSSWGIESSTILSSFDAWVLYTDSSNHIHAEAIIGYESAFDMNNVGNSGLICTVDSNGQTGPVQGSTQYRNILP